jgi:hypothetical protein
VTDGTYPTAPFSWDAGQPGDRVFPRVFLLGARRRQVWTFGPLSQSFTYDSRLQLGDIMAKNPKPETRKLETSWPP